jgi:ferredoxin
MQTSTNSDAAGAPVIGIKQLRVSASRSACCGYGVCAEICPEVYTLDDNGIVVLAHEIVPAGLESKAREGAAACPQNALTIHEA